MSRTCFTRLFSAHKSLKINVAIVEKYGTCRQQSFPIKDVKKNLGLHYRDIITLGIASDNVQKINSSTHSNSIPSLLLPRESCILASFGNVRAAILVDKVIIFDPNLTVSKTCIRDLCSKNFAGKEPFEHQVLEELLKDMCNNYDRRVALYNSLFINAITPPNTDEDGGTNLLYKYSLLSNILRWNDSKSLASSDESIHRLSPVADLCHDLTLELQGAQSCLNNTLQSAEHMATLLLTCRLANASLGPSAPPSASAAFDKYEDDGGAAYGNFTRSTHFNPNEQDWSEEEQRENIELLLNNYLLRISHSISHVRQLQQKIKSKQDLADLNLKVTRNRLLWLNVNLAATAVCMGLFSGACGIFGMNLPSGLESSKVALLLVTGASLGVSATVYYRLLKYMYGYSGPDNSASMQQQAIEDTRVLIDDVLKDSPTIDILLKLSYQRINHPNSDGRLSKGEFAKIFADVKGGHLVGDRAVDAVYDLLKDRNGKNMVEDRRTR